MQEKNILLTSRPGMGKTTVLIKLSQLLKNEAAGFYTREIRQHNRRQGFEIVSLKGKSKVLAHVDFPSSRYRVSKYGVKPENLEEFLAEIKEVLDNKESKCLLIDEIGKMELFNEKFKERVEEAVDSRLPVIATIMSKKDPFCDALKKRPDVKVIEVTGDNRDDLPQYLYKWVKSLYS